MSHNSPLTTLEAASPIIVQEGTAEIINYNTGCIRPTLIGFVPQEFAFGVIPKYAIAEFIALTIGLVVSLALVSINIVISPTMANVFLVPLFASLAGIVFMIVKRHEP